MQAFVPKNRRPKFEVTLRIIDLNNVPLVSGTSYVKWNIPFSAAADHRGRTAKASIKDHKVAWDYEKTFSIRLTIDKNNMLQGSDIQFEVNQEYMSGARGERIMLGSLRLNLAEYVEGVDGGGQEGITRRYLMQDSKINSTLKISIIMKQIDGDRSFQTPPLKTAPVFGGIAGIVAGDQGEHDDSNCERISTSVNASNYPIHMADQSASPADIPSLVSKSREIGELQDMYRRTLAASWSCQAGQMPADECIENIFAGGDGWRDRNVKCRTWSAREKPDDREDESGSISDADSGRKSNETQRPRHTKGRSSGQGHVRGVGDLGSSGDAVPRVGQRRDRGASGAGERNGGSFKSAHEVDELDVREDLKCWSLPAGV